MFHIALKMLLGDRAKYIMLISGLSFATLLIAQQGSVFCGIMTWTTSNLKNTPATVWVVDPKVEQLNDVIPMRDTDLARVRSVSGVSYAMPLYAGLLQARMPNGFFKIVQIFGIDSTTFKGAPPLMLQGNVMDLLQNNGVIVSEYGLKQLSQGRTTPLTIGDTFEINDHEARIVGIAKTRRSWTGAPIIYTTYERALEYAPPLRKMLSFVLVEPQGKITDVQLARQIEKETGLKAYTQKEFAWSTIWWFFRNTGIPISFGTTIILGFVVGVAVSGQTFYSFVLENMKNLGALKAMGASNWLLCRMLILQAFTVGLIGYGIGIGLAAWFGFVVLKKEQPPFYLPMELLAGSFAVIVFICFLSALIGIWKVARLEAAIVFRG